MTTKDLYLRTWLLQRGHRGRPAAVKWLRAYLGCTLEEATAKLDEVVGADLINYPPSLWPAALAVAARKGMDAELCAVHRLRALHSPAEGYLRCWGQQETEVDGIPVCCPCAEEATAVAEERWEGEDLVADELLEDLE